MISKSRWSPRRGTHSSARSTTRTKTRCCVCDGVKALEVVFPGEGGGWRPPARPRRAARGSRPAAAELERRPRRAGVEPVAIAGSAAAAAPALHPLDAVAVGHLPSCSTRCWRTRGPAALTGEHDFRALAPSQTRRRVFVRVVERAEWVRRSDHLDLRDHGEQLSPPYGAEPGACVQAPAAIPGPSRPAAHAPKAGLTAHHGSPWPCLLSNSLFLGEEERCDLAGCELQPHQLFLLVEPVRRAGRLRLSDSGWGFGLKTRRGRGRCRPPVLEGTTTSPPSSSGASNGSSRPGSSIGAARSVRGAQSPPTSAPSAAAKPISRRAPRRPRARCASRRCATRDGVCRDRAANPRWAADRPDDARRRRDDGGGRGDGTRRRVARRARNRPRRFRPRCRHSTRFSRRRRW